MSELAKRLGNLTLRVDRMGLLAEQALADALEAVKASDVPAGLAIEQDDSAIDREEVEIERECIRLLALYQPAAIDLRKICFIIKVNNDLERIADMATSIGACIPSLVADKIDAGRFDGFDTLAGTTRDLLGRTIRLLGIMDLQAARNIIDDDRRIDQHYLNFAKAVLDNKEELAFNVDGALTLITLAKSLERIGDHCTNIAEDVVFLNTGDIIRHTHSDSAL